MPNIKLKKYIDYGAMYDIAVMEPYMASFKKLEEYIGTSEAVVMMIEEGIKGLPINEFNYQGRIVTYHNAGEIEKVGKVLFSFLKNTEKWNALNNRLSVYEKELEPFINVASTNKILTDAEEKNTYLSVYEKYYNLYLEIITIYLITDGRYHEYSIKEITQHNVSQEAINQLTLPTKQSSFQIANKELDNIGKLFKANQPWQDEFAKFLDKYVWLYLADTHYDFDQIVVDLKKKLSLDISSDLKIENSVGIDSSTVGIEDKKVLQRIAELGFQRMELRRYWQWIDFLLHSLMYNFAKEHQLPEKTLVFLSEQEVKKVFSGHTKADGDLLKFAQNRSEIFGIVLDGDIKITHNKDDVERFKTKYISEDNISKIVKGSISYRNKDEDVIRGVARVVTWSKEILKDLETIKDGEILVVTQTKPDFLPFLKKIKALVADEGGITSHVSIVSRELKIPAIVGTRTGTDTIKSGDTIELNMTTGEVKTL
jgi:phosphohistidine swiveling domain-containing protein/predicted lactoylglutathione lyase